MFVNSKVFSNGLSNSGSLWFLFIVVKQISQHPYASTVDYIKEHFCISVCLFLAVVPFSLDAEKNVDIWVKKCSNFYVVLELCKLTVRFISLLSIVISIIIDCFIFLTKSEY